MKTNWSVIVIVLYTCFVCIKCKESDDPVPPAASLPTITGFSPTSGATGISVTITGTNFSVTPSDIEVKFNGTLAITTVATATSITVTVPAGATTGKITVDVDGEVATSAGDFTVNPSVTLTGFTPLKGASGTIVTLTGTNFSTIPAHNVVKFNGTAAVVTAAGATSLTVTAPEGASTGKITVQVDNQVAISANDFEVIATEATVLTTAGNGTLGFADGNGAEARFYQPTGVALDANGNLYVADAENHCIRKITAAGSVSTLAGSTTLGSADGPGAAAQFSSPRAVAVDGAGNVYVADGANHKIRKITPAGVVSTLAGTGAFGFADGDGAVAKFYFPKGIAVDGDGYIYVADDINHKIRKITPAGVVTTLAGSTSGFADGDGAAALFNSPRGVAVDTDGNLYVADAGNHRIRKITPTGTVSTLAGSTSGFTDSSGASARFNAPAGVAVDASGNVYVADDENERIRKVTQGGAVNTVAGGFLPGFADGEGSDAQFNSPTGIALDASGRIYVADRHNHSIRQIQK